MGCVHIVVGKNESPVQLKYGQKKEINYSSIVFLISKEEVDMDEVISHSPKK